MENYYEKFQLKRNERSENILIQLNNQLASVKNQRRGDINNENLAKTMSELNIAISIFSNSDSRKEYDSKLFPKREKMKSQEEVNKNKFNELFDVYKKYYRNKEYSLTIKTANELDRYYSNLQDKPTEYPFLKAMVHDYNGKFDEALDQIEEAILIDYSNEVYLYNRIVIATKKYGKYHSNTTIYANNFINLIDNKKIHNINKNIIDGFSEWLYFEQTGDTLSECIPNKNAQHQKIAIMYNNYLRSANYKIKNPIYRYINYKKELDLENQRNQEQIRLQEQKQAKIRQIGIEFEQELKLLETKLEKEKSKLKSIKRRALFFLGAAIVLPFVYSPDFEWIRYRNNVPIFILEVLRFAENIAGSMILVMVTICSVLIVKNILKRKWTTKIKGIVVLVIILFSLFITLTLLQEVDQFILVSPIWLIIAIYLLYNLRKQSTIDSVYDKKKQKIQVEYSNRINQVK